MRLTHFINGKLSNKYNDVVNEEEKNNKNYKFLLDNIYNYIYITDRLIFIRETDDYKFEVIISNEPSCNIILKNENKEMSINVISSNYNINDNYIEFKYTLETDEDEHHIILEIGE